MIDIIYQLTSTPEVQRSVYCVCLIVLATLIR